MRRHRQISLLIVGSVAAAGMMTLAGSASAAARQAATATRTRTPRAIAPYAGPQTIKHDATTRAGLREIVKAQTTEAKAGGTSGFDFQPAPSVDWSFVSPGGDWGSPQQGTPGKITVKASSLTGGTMPITAAGPASAHYGLPAAQYAKNDTIVITARVTGQSPKVIARVKSVGLVSLIDVAVPVVKGKTTRLSYDRVGQGGGAGSGVWPGGRQWDIVGQ